MSFIEKQVQFGRELLDLNAQTFRKLAELQVEGLKNYFETNQEYVRKLPEVRSVASFVELQQDYGKTLWTGVQDDLTTRGEIARDVVETAGSLIRGAYVTAESDTDTQAPAA